MRWRLFQIKKSAVNTGTVPELELGCHKQSESARRFGRKSEKLLRQLEQLESGLEDS
jgi:hypothetical protein